MSNSNEKWSDWFSKNKYKFAFGVSALAISSGIYYFLNRSTDNDDQQEDLKELSIRLAKDAFKHYEKRQFREAASLFTEAICLDGTNYRFFTNRALVHSKLNMHQKVVSDCTRSIELQETSKAYFLRARSRVELQNYDAALSDLKKCEKWNDKSTRSQVQNLIRRCLKKLGQKEELIEHQKAVAGMNQYEEMKRSLKTELDRDVSVENLQPSTDSNDNEAKNAYNNDTIPENAVQSIESLQEQNINNLSTNNTNEEVSTNNINEEVSTNDTNEGVSTSNTKKNMSPKNTSNENTSNQNTSNEDNGNNNSDTNNDISESVMSIHNSTDQEPVNSLLLSQDQSESSSKLFSSAINVEPSDSIIAQKE